MPRSRPAHPPKFQQRLIELVHAGRSPEELAKEFEPTAQTIPNWVARVEANAGKHPALLSGSEREELGRIRKENRNLRVEREILARTSAQFAREA